MISIQAISSWGYCKLGYKKNHCTYAFLVFFVVVVWLFFFVCLFFRATLVAYGGFQPRGRMGAVAAGLHQSHSNAESKLSLQPTPQLMAMLDP